MSHHKRDVYKIYPITSMSNRTPFQFFTFTAGADKYETTGLSALVLKQPL